ncbi:MAG: CDP-alcohol phosphatidyltransferase family protein [Desulfobacteraceae bacterium]
MSRYKSTISIPNILTLARILLTPLFVILLLRDLFPMALLVFAVAGISDGLDGLIARYMNQRTALGAYLDPAADKLLLISSFIALAVLGIIPSWISVIVIARDVIILLGLAILMLTEKKYEVSPTLVSKCTTTVQILTVLVTLYDPTHLKVALLHPVLLWSTAILTTLSGLHYIYIGMNILQEPNNNEKS